jgi:predicted nucleic acid-binding protein
MRVIVDTSVWSLALRRHAPSKNPEAVLLTKLIGEGENIFLLGIILQEILQGVKVRSDFERLKEHFDAFPMLPVRREHYVKAAELRNYLSTKGIQTSTVDALIAASAISHECQLFTTDRDFHSIAKHSALKLLTRHH